MTTLARRERAAMCVTLQDQGGAAPTLCGSWTAAELASHIIIRERHPAAIGNAVPFVTPWTAAVQRRYSTRPFSELVDLVRSGPPWWSPMSLPGADELANTLEFFVHHEDVRRAGEQWNPRTLPTEDETTLWEHLSKRSRLLLRRSSVPVRLTWPEYRSKLVVASESEGEAAVTVTGQPGELTMYLHGRKAHAQVTVDGEQGAVRAFSATDLSV